MNKATKDFTRDLAALLAKHNVTMDMSPMDCFCCSKLTFESDQLNRELELEIHCEMDSNYTFNSEDILKLIGDDNEKED